jgi:hypothetical protein
MEGRKDRREAEDEMTLEDEEEEERGRGDRASFKADKGMC